MLDALYTLSQSHGHIVPHQTIQHINQLWRTSLEALLLDSHSTPEEYILAQGRFRNLGEIFLHTLNGGKGGMSER